nr:MAG TPA: minor tail protein [Caudoviricetes sp.]
MDEQYGIKVKVDGLDQIDKLDKAASKLDKSLAGLGGDVRNIQKSRRELAETAARARQAGLVAAESAAKMSQANTAAAKAIAGLAANSKAAGKALQNSESAASRLMAALAGRDTAEKFSNELRQIKLGAEASSGSLDKLTSKMAAYKRMAESFNRTRIEPPVVVNPMTAALRDNSFSNFAAKSASIPTPADKSAFLDRQRVFAAASVESTKLNAQAVKAQAEVAKEITKAARATENWTGKLKTTAVQSAHLHDVWRGIAASTGNLWLSWGNFAGMAAGLAAGGAVFKSLNVEREFGWQMEQVGIAGDVGAKRLNELKASILDINQAGSLQGPVQMASALRMLTQAGMETQEALRNLPTVLNFSLVAEISDDQSSQFLAGMRSAFDLKTPEQLREAADQAAKAAAVSQTSIQKMSEALKQASPEAARFGLTVADTSTALAILAKYNIEGSSAGTSLRRLISDLSGRTPKATKALNELGLSIYNSRGMVKPFTQVVEELRDKLSNMTDEAKQKWLKSIFDERGLKAASVLLSEAGKEFGSMNAEILRAGENMGYTSTSAARLANTSEGAFRTMKNAWEGAFAAIGTSAQDPFKGLMHSLASVANDPSARAFGTILTNGFLIAAKAGVNLAGVLSPLLPAVGGLTAAYLAKTAAVRLGAIADAAAARAQVMKMQATVADTVAETANTGAAVANTAAVSANTAAQTGLTAAIARTGLVARGLFAAMGGWVGVAVAGVSLVAYHLLKGETAAKSFKDQVSELNSQFQLTGKVLGAIDIDKFDRFNKEGIGKAVDVKLGIGYVAEDPSAALKAGSGETLRVYSENQRKILSVTEEVHRKIRETYDETSKAGQEQELMLTERKLTLLKQQLAEFDKSTADIVKLDSGASQIRKNLEQSVHDAALALMRKRTEYAKSQMRELAAEAARQAGFIDRLLNPNVRIQDEALALKKDSERTQADKQYQLLRLQGVRADVAHAQAYSSMNGGNAEALREQLSTPNGRKSLKETLLANPEQGRVLLAEYRAKLEQDISDNYVRLKNNKLLHDDAGKGGIKQVYATPVEAQAYFARAAGELSRLKEITDWLNAMTRAQVKNSTKDRQAPSTELGRNTPDTGKSKVKTPPSYSGIGANNVYLKTAENEYNRLKTAVEREAKTYGVATEATWQALQKAEIAVARLKDTAENLNIDKQLDAARKAAANKDMPAEDRRRALDDIKALEAQKSSRKADVGDAGFKLTVKYDHVGYKFGSKDLGNGVIDCSGFVSNLYDATIEDLNAKLGERRFSSGRLKYLSAADQIKTFARDTVMTGNLRDLSLSQFKAGMLIGTDNGPQYDKKTGKQWDKGRYKGIDHIVMVVKDEGGNLFASQSSGKKGVNMTPLAKYLSSARNGAATVVDPFASARSAVTDQTPMKPPANYEQAALQKQLEEGAQRRLKLAEQTYQKELLHNEAERQKLKVQETLGQISARKRANEEYLLDVLKQELETKRRISELEAQGKFFEANQVRENSVEKLKQMEENFVAQQRAQSSWSVGLSKSYEQMVDSSLDYGNMAVQMFDTTVNGLVRTAQVMALEGKQSFSDMARAIMADLARIAIRMTAMKLINVAVGLFSGGVGGGGAITGKSGNTNFFGDHQTLTLAKGGAFDSSGRLTAYAAGGVVNSPTYFRHGGGRGLMGESGPEAVLPLSRMPNGDLGVQMAGQGGGGVYAPVNVTVTVHSDGSSDSKVDAQGLGKQLGNQIRATVMEVLVREQMNGGLLYESR